MQIKRVEFKNKSGDTLVGIVHAPSLQGKFPFVVLSHGLGSSKDNMAEWCEHFAQSGIASLRFDFSGHGESTGRIEDATFSKFVGDHVTAAEFARRIDKCDGRVALCGHSLGAATSLAAAAEAKADAVIAVSSFYDYKVLLRRLKSLGVSKLGDLLEKGYLEKKFVVSPRALFRIYTDLMRFDTKKRLLAIRCPVLVVHGDRDEIVPVEEAKRIYEALNCKKELKIFEGMTHFFLKISEKKELFEATAGWLAGELLSG